MILVFNDADIRIPLIILAVIVILICIAYLLLICCTSFFMYSFSREINKKLEFLNLIIYQKCEAINQISEELSKYINETNPLYLFLNNPNYKEYHKLSTAEIEEFYYYTEKMITEIQKIYINNDLEELKKPVEHFFKNVEDMNEKYYQTSQLYNTKVIGYNYWRNFFSTKWLKKILHIKEKQTI